MSRATGLLLVLGVALGLGVGLGVGLGATAAFAETLAPGMKAPAFELEGTDGETRSLSDYVGKRAVVLAWFPKAFTPG